MRRWRIQLAVTAVGALVIAGCATRSPEIGQPVAAQPAEGQPAAAPPAGGGPAAASPSADQAAAARTPFQLPPNPMIGGVAMYPSRDILDNLTQSPEHKTLVAALNVGGAAATLKQPGPFTVFAPTDAAFRSLPSGLLDQLMQPANQTRLVRLLETHVVRGRSDSTVLGQQLANNNGSIELTTLAGSKLVARPNGAVNLLLRDPAGGFADISIYDVMNANGVIHVIDKVLLPAQNP
jgi:uncharacterized surface protein with fasciclin (FAS1) repeats